MSFKKPVFFISVVIAISSIGYKIDHTFYMPKRVRNVTWIYSHGYSVGDVINPERYTMRDDTLFFLDGEFVTVRYQYFDDLVICDSTNETGIYEKLGSHRYK